MRLSNFVEKSFLTNVNVRSKILKQDLIILLDVVCHFITTKSFRKKGVVRMGWLLKLILILVFSLSMNIVLIAVILMYLSNKE